MDEKFPPLKLYNTLTRSKDVFTPLNPMQVAMYTCGPTVYNFAHIGNFRTYVFEDLLRRTIKLFGYRLTHVMNLTDVDDKTIKGAIAHGVSLDAYTKPYKDAFFEDLDRLNIERAEHYPAATEYIAEMIEVIQKLLEKKNAYIGGDGSIYFAISRFGNYGCLSHLRLDELKAGASNRTSSDEYDKENISDFVLWKKYDEARDGSIFWESPFGPGRPGWHLECSTMAMKILGPTIDIHAGGVDNMFPHHENEIAQSECYSEKLFSRVWMHAEHLIVDGKKMSKSLGNFYLLRDLLSKGYTGVQIRYLLLQTHYKTQLNFTLQGLDGAKQALKRLQDFIDRLLTITEVKNYGKTDQVLARAHKNFIESLADDLNISSALAAVFELVREINVFCDAKEIGKDEACQVVALLKEFNKVLGILSFDKEAEVFSEDLTKALEQRNDARKAKNWALADELRDFIASKGFVIEDTPQGAKLKKR